MGRPLPQNAHPGDIWNVLPVIELWLSFSTLKHKIKEFLCSYFLNSFDSDIICSWH